jgi:hypothetical protein
MYTKDRQSLLGNTGNKELLIISRIKPVEVSDIIKIT